MSHFNRSKLVLLISFLGIISGNCQNISTKSYSPAFASILGNNAKITLIAESNDTLFHEGAVYHKATKSLFCSSDFDDFPSVITHVTGLVNTSSTLFSVLNSTIPYPNGGFPYLSDSNVLVWLGQGSLTVDGGVYFLSPYPPYNTTQILSAYGDFPFNSPNDISVTPSGDIYFSDPTYGFVYGQRKNAYLPNQVYRFTPSTGAVRAVADGFSRSNGLGTNKDGSVVYVIDTGAQVDNTTIDLQGARTVYSFDVQHPNGTKSSSGSLLGNRRLFAFPDIGGAKGIKTDTVGNVYLGIDDGISVWGEGGELLGKILIEGGIANLGFGEPGVIFGMGGKKLWRIDISKDIIGSSYLL